MIKVCVKVGPVQRYVTSPYNGLIPLGILISYLADHLQKLLLSTAPLTTVQGVVVSVPVLRAAVKLVSKPSPIQEAIPTLVIYNSLSVTAKKSILESRVPSALVSALAVNLSPLATTSYLAPYLLDDVNQEQSSAAP